MTSRCDVTRCSKFVKFRSCVKMTRLDHVHLQDPCEATPIKIYFLSNIVCFRFQPLFKCCDRRTDGREIEPRTISIRRVT